METTTQFKNAESSQEELFVKEIINDFRTCCISREASLLARADALKYNRAKFAIVGDGKEVPQVAMARAFKKGDFRSGYYRDQTLMFALGLQHVEDFFAQLYADTENDPYSGGRQMNSHYATPLVDKNTGQWTNHLEQYNISSDVSCTGGQMARGLGLAFASKKYRESEAIRNSTTFSNNGNEVCFVTIGDASTSEGVFWESMNAAAVMKVPMAVAVWDDGYGISVPIDLQTTKKSISKALSGFQLDEDGEGIEIYTCKAWDYPALCEMFELGVDKMRQTHIPALFHVQEVTQPQGHSSSGSHERYKTKERLAWEIEHDCITVMARWMVSEGIATQEEIDAIKEEVKIYVRDCRNRSWEKFMTPNVIEREKLLQIYQNLAINESANDLISDLNANKEPMFSELVKNARRMMIAIADQPLDIKENLLQWLQESNATAKDRYESHLYSDSSKSALKVPIVAPTYSDNASMKQGYEILNTFFDITFENYPNTFAFGEDVGKIGDVNQGFMGLQDKYGVERVFDVGIREWTIMGQAIGMAMRGLRPITEIQYLDYLIYGLEPLSDDLATLRWRSNGQQAAPAIIRTRGHRLEGIWHSGSPIGMILNSIRGMYVLTPRNMVQAVGMYNTMLQSDDPAIIIECLNGYRLREKMPENIGNYTVALGMPEILQEGNDITLVTYGSTVRVAQEASAMLKHKGISVELIDAQTLLPFDLEHICGQSIKKTNRLLVLDEDVPGGASAYILHEILEKQGAYRWLDAAPQTLTAKAHRPPYGSDGDYFCKPNAEDIFETIFQIVKE